MAGYLFIPASLIGFFIGYLIPCATNYFHRKLKITKIKNSHFLRASCAFITAVAYGLVINHFGISWAAVFAIIFTTSLITLSVIDFLQYLLPDLITLPLICLGLLVNCFGMLTNVQDAIIGALAGYSILYAVYILYKTSRKKEGLGSGDFKLFAMLGAWIGGSYLFPILMIASFIGSVAGTALIVLRKHKANVPIAFGPYLSLAGFIMLLWKNNLAEFYIYLLN